MRAKLIAVLLASLVALPAQAGIQDVIDAMKRGDIVGAIKAMVSPSLLDDAEMQMGKAAADLAPLGIHVPQQAIRQAAQLGANGGQIADELVQRYAATFEQIRARASDNDVDALKALSVMYARGWGVRRSLIQAYVLQGAAADRDKTWAPAAKANQEMLAGQMSQDDLAEAIRLSAQASAGGKLGQSIALDPD